MKDLILGLERVVNGETHLPTIETWAEGRRRAYLCAHRGNTFYYVDSYGNLRQGTSGLRHGDISVDQVRAAITKINEMTDEQISDVFYPDAVPYTRDYAHNCGLFLSLFDAVIEARRAQLESSAEDVLAQATAALTE